MCSGLKHWLNLLTFFPIDPIIFPPLIQTLLTLLRSNYMREFKNRYKKKTKTIFVYISKFISLAPRNLFSKRRVSSVACNVTKIFIFKTQNVNSLYMVRILVSRLREIKISMFLFCMALPLNGRYTCLLLFILLSSSSSSDFLCTYVGMCGLCSVHFIMMLDYVVYIVVVTWILNKKKTHAKHHTRRIPILWMKRKHCDRCPYTDEKVA